MYLWTSEEIEKILLQLDAMQDQCEDIINSYAANSWDDIVTIDSLKYLGNYFLTRKDTTYYGIENRCYMVYKITAKQEMDTINDGHIIENADSYYYICFYNPMLDSDGTGAVDISNYEVSYNSFTVETDYEYDNGWWTDNYSFTYKGYDSLDKLYNDVVTKNLEKFNHQDNVTE